MSKQINSKRTYEIVIVEGDGEFNQIKLSLDRILYPKEMGKDFEYLYALNDLVDKILDLKFAESMYFQPNRDNYNSQGIILRTN